MESAHSAVEIGCKLTTGLELLARGRTIRQACEHLRISEPTFYRWRRHYAGMNAEQITCRWRPGIEPVWRPELSHRSAWWLARCAGPVESEG